MVVYDTFQIVEALDSVSKKEEVVYRKDLKPDLIEYLEHWEMVKENPSDNYPYELTEGGLRVLESQRVKQFRRKHFFDFLSKLNKKIEENRNYISYDFEGKDGSLILWTRIAYDRTTNERRILDEIAKEVHMTVETEGEAQGPHRKYMLKNSKFQMDLQSTKRDAVFNRRTTKVCDPLIIKVNPSKPISPAEKILTLLTERLKVKR